MPNEPAFFGNEPIRRIYDTHTDTWWFSVVDIIKILTQQQDVRRAGTYWKVLKNRLSKEGSQLVTNCNQLKLPAEDGKERLTDCATVETLLRLVQSVPSPKAEPIKLWLAKVGFERMQELADPALSIDRSSKFLLRKSVLSSAGSLVFVGKFDGWTHAFPAFRASCIFNSNSSKSFQ
jgi:DNA-damage-inducible protein D